MLSASYDVDMAKRVGIPAAALLNKLVYLQRFTTREDGFCWRTAVELEEELGLTRKMQTNAIKKLEEAGLIETKVAHIQGTSVPCKHFRVSKSYMLSGGSPIFPDSHFDKRSNWESDKRSKSYIDNNNNNLISNNQTVVIIQELRQIVDEYNKICTRLPKVKWFSQKSQRVKHLKARLDEYGAETVVSVFRAAQESDFLCGQNNSGWKATFDWIVKPGNFVKILEGNYANRAGGRAQEFADAFAEIEEYERNLGISGHPGTGGGTREPQGLPEHPGNEGALAEVVPASDQCDPVGGVSSAGRDSDPPDGGGVGGLALGDLGDLWGQDGD